MKKGFIYNITKYRLLYFLLLPGLLYFLIFCYIPMYGVLIAFQDFSPSKGITGILLDPVWVGLKHFKNFFSSYYFERLLVNTFSISFLKLVIQFISAVTLALLMNEVIHTRFKRVVQTISYLPHFLSWVIVSGLVSVILSRDGLVNNIIFQLGGERRAFMGNSGVFRYILVVSHVWKEVGWGTIIYLAALASINPELYESANIDGASRFKKMWYISIPGISHIMVLLLVMAMGNILNAGFEQIFLMYSVPVYKVADIIDTFVYREGLGNSNFSYSSAIGLFKNVIGLIFIFSANFTAKKMGREGIW
jgi:putative aldouronate transport system permease protein